MSNSDFSDTGFATRAVHVGQEPDAETGAVIPPLHATSTFVQTEFGVPGKYIYSRSGNPTRTALEANLAALESAEFGIAFASGCAATDSIVRLLKPGAHILAGTDLYGGTYRLFEQVLRDFGFNFEYVDTTDVGAIANAWRDDTAMVYIETPTNPLMSLTDIAAVAELTRERGARMAVDNTFMSPYLQRPLELGADLVLHSTTKYINGHSDSIGGIVMTNDTDDAERLRFIAKSVGATLSPFEAWLIQRGVKTLAIRMERSESTARQVVDLLDGHPKVEHVYYPGLESHPQHELAKRQMDGFGGMVSFEVADMAAVKRLLDSLQVFTLAESLGGVETLISNPASMTHASIPAEERAARGVKDGLIRISCGVEDAEDLLADLRQGLDKI
jgi:cystathionine beta-lyase/cystathionine gamma-synthase